MTLGKAAPPHFLWTRCGLPQILEARLVANLPARVDPVGEPHFADRFRQFFLTILGLLSRDVVGAGGEGVHRDRRLALLAFPNAGDAEEVDVEAGPEVVAEVQDEAARGEIVLRESLAEIAAVEGAAEEGKVFLHEVAEIVSRDCHAPGFLGGHKGNAGEGKEKPGKGRQTHLKETRAEKAVLLLFFTGVGAF